MKIKKIIHRIKKKILKPKSLIVYTVVGIIIGVLGNFVYAQLFYDETQMNEIIALKKTINNNDEEIKELISKINISTDDIKKLIDNLPFEKGKNFTNYTINEWYSSGKINNDEKSLLNGLSYKYFSILNIIDKKRNNKELSEFYNPIYSFYKKKQSINIKDFYFQNL